MRAYVLANRTLDESQKWIVRMGVGRNWLKIILNNKTNILCLVLVVERKMNFMYGTSQEVFKSEKRPLNMGLICI